MMLSVFRHVFRLDCLGPWRQVLGRYLPNAKMLGAGAPLVAKTM